MKHGIIYKVIDKCICAFFLGNHHIFRKVLFQQLCSEILSFVIRSIYDLFLKNSGSLLTETIRQITGSRIPGGEFWNTKTISDLKCPFFIGTKIHIIVAVSYRM